MRVSVPRIGSRNKRMLEHLPDDGHATIREIGLNTSSPEL